MTGMEFEEIDDVVKDGIGEICNMLAGAWKGKVPNLAANCGLSVPAVITGSNYHLHVQAPEFQLHHAYRFEDACFDVTIVCDGLQLTLESATEEGRPFYSGPDACLQV